MGKVKEAIMTVEDYYLADRKVYVDTWNRFVVDNKDNSGAFANISGNCPSLSHIEGRMQAFATIAEDLLGDSSLWEDFNDLNQKMCDQTVEMLGRCKW